MNADAHFETYGRYGENGSSAPIKAESAGQFALGRATT
jgi:hypothetical protein